MPFKEDTLKKSQKLSVATIQLDCVGVKSHFSCV